MDRLGYARLTATSLGISLGAEYESRAAVLEAELRALYPKLRERVEQDEDRIPIEMQQFPETFWWRREFPY
jgi:hypothetical protein